MEKSLLKSKLNNKDIIDAIVKAENKSSGEIRVHIAAKLKKDVYPEAVNIFSRLGMQKTVHRNGVLIYIAEKNRKFAIIGDKGVNEVIDENYWENQKEILSNHFKNEKFTEGLSKVINNIGITLQKHFPLDDENLNELPNEISYE